MAARSTTLPRVRTAVLGATGYVGAELLRLLVRHPCADLVYVSSEQYAGRDVADVFPFLSGAIDLRCGPSSGVGDAEAEVVFVAVPHGTAMPLVTAALSTGARVLDLSADFRFRDPDVYARWYGPHAAPELLAEAVYGLPEVNRAPLRSARLVAVPGCYPTGALLGLLPLARSGVIGGPVVIDSKSGTTGAGRSLKVEQLFAEVNENFRPYAVLEHRHGPEIEQALVAAGASWPTLFVPHLLPVSRGILSTMYVPLADPATDVDALYHAAYGAEPFVTVRGSGRLPELREVRGTNRCVLAWRRDERTRHLVVVTAIDNLGKGAAGQAVQCLNVLLDVPETTGLEAPALGL